MVFCFLFFLFFFLCFDFVFTIFFKFILFFKLLGVVPNLKWLFILFFIVVLHLTWEDYWIMFWEKKKIQFTRWLFCRQKLVMFWALWDTPLWRGRCQCQSSPSRETVLTLLCADHKCTCLVVGTYWSWVDGQVTMRHLSVRREKIKRL